MSRKKQTPEEVLASAVRKNSHLDFGKFVLTDLGDLGQVSCKTCQTSWLATLNRLRSFTVCRECSRRKARGETFHKTITKTRVEALLSLFESKEISKMDVMAKLFPYSADSEETIARVDDSLTPLGRFLGSLEHTWVGLASDLFDHLRELYPESSSPQLASAKALGWAIREWRGEGLLRISKKRTSAGQQYTIRPVEHKSEQCRSTGMLIHTLESTSFDIPNE